MAGKKEWYVLRAISGKEAKVKELLDAQIKNTSLGDYVSQVLIPTEKIYSTTKSGKKVVKERTLYSGYVFVEAELIGEVTHILRNTTNVIDFLGCGQVSLGSGLVMLAFSMGDSWGWTSVTFWGG